MRVKYDKYGSIEIILKEEPILYFDEPKSIDLRPKVYFSEKGELAKIRLSKLTGEEEKENEFIIPDGLPWREYVYTWDKEHYGCIDDYTDIWNTDDGLDMNGHLMIQRRDRREMHEDEKKGLREQFFKDFSYWRPDLDYLYSLNSAYRNRKLYFWKTKETLSDPLEIIQDAFDYLLFHEETLKKRNFGIDIINPYDQLALICIYNDDFEKNREERVITKEQLIDRCRKTKKYKNRRIILLLTELSENAIEYAKSQNIEIQDSLDIAKEKFMEQSAENDDLAQDSEINVSDRFFEYQEEVMPQNKSTTDDKHTKSSEYPEPSDNSLILKDSNTSKPK